MRLLLLFLLQFLISIQVETKKNRYPIYWGVPTDQCFRKNVDIPAEPYHILQNKNLAFNGEKVVTLYEHKVGKFPRYYHHNKDQIEYGGIPQKSDHNAHYDQLRRDIESIVPNVTYDGPIVVDMEEWRPDYFMNYGKKEIYKNASKDYVRERYPNKSEKEIEEMAATEFNESARKLLLGTIQLIRSMRPSAKISMYGLPECWPGEIKQRKCGDIPSTEYFADFILEESDFICPSLYLPDKAAEIPYEEHYYNTFHKIKNAQRIALSKKLPLIPFTAFEYSLKPAPEDIQFYTKQNLCIGFKLPADMGAEGLLIWSTSGNMKERCEYIRQDMLHYLGPAVKIIWEEVHRCAKKRCSDNGRCVRRNAKSTDKCDFLMPVSEYNCICDEGYTGNWCETKL